MKVEKNNPKRAGELASKKVRFGQFGRYAVAAIHTRFDSVEWFVWDAEHPRSSLQRAEVIRQASTYDEAIAGLEASA